MRNARLIFMMAACLSVVVLTGCSKSKDRDSEIDELNKKVEALTKAVIIDEKGIARLATPTPVAIGDYKAYGFGLPVPSNVKVTTAGLTGKDASADGGSLLASAGGASLFLVWNKVDPPLTPQESVVGGFSVLQSLTQANFEAVGAGSGLTVDNQPGSYGTFVARNTNGTVDGVGIIGGWICPNDKWSYSMTVTGKDLEPVQQSFVFLTNGFRCDAGKAQTAPPATPTAAPTKASPTATARP